jgi:hypothetical protein
VLFRSLVDCIWTGFRVRRRLTVSVEVKLRYWDLCMLGLPVKLYLVKMHLQSDLTGRCSSPARSRRLWRCSDLARFQSFCLRVAEFLAENGRVGVVEKSLILRSIRSTFYCI